MLRQVRRKGIYNLKYRVEYGLSYTVTRTKVYGVDYIVVGVLVFVITCS